MDSSERIWIASDSGLYYTDKKMKTFTLVSKKNFEYATLLELNQKIFIGTIRGLYSIPADAKMMVIDTLHLFDGKTISFMGASPSGKLCITTFENDFFLIDVNSNTPVIIKRANFSFRVKSVFFQDEDTLWIGTNAGFMRYVVSKNNLKVFTEKDGLVNNYVYCVLKGNDGKLWMCTNHGISRFDMATERFTNYGLSEGVQALEFNARSFYQSLHSTIYFGGVAGFNYFNPSKIKDFPFEPSIQLLNVTVNDNAVSLEKFLDQKAPVKFQSNENNISIEFAAIDFNRKDNINYLYKLHDKDAWTSIGNRRTLNFANLSHGNYNFEAEAEYSYNEVSPHILKFAFTVLPPFYETYWFIIIISTAFILIIYSMYRYRVNQLKKLYTLRTKISRDLHDDIGSTLGSISIYSEVAKNRSEKSENADEAIAKIGNASRELIDKMSDIVWSINPKNERFENLLNRIQVFAAIMLTPHEILYNIYSDEEVKNLKLTAEERKNIYLIYKEAIHNIIKYATCTQVEIKMSLDANEFVMSIKDNGKGFDINMLQESNGSLGGNGIKNMKARAENINSDFSIQSIINAGTTIGLKLKV